MPQIAETSSSAAQIEYWNASAGETWAQFQEALDRQVEPLGLAAMDLLAREKESISSTSAADAGRPRWPSPPECDQQVRSLVSISRSPCLMRPFADRARPTCGSPFESWTHKPAISGMSFSMRRTLALA
jgi:hypothetical protein